MNAAELYTTRRRLGLTVEDAAAVISKPDGSTGVNVKTWRRWEKGVDPVPPFAIASLLALEETMGAAVDFLVTDAPSAPSGELASTLYQYKTREAHAADTSAHPVPFSAHGMLVVWAEEALIGAGHNVTIEWSDHVPDETRDEL